MNLENVSLQNLLPSNIVEIETKAFLGCSNLMTIVFPDTLKKIGGQALKAVLHLTILNFRMVWKTW